MLSAGPTPYTPLSRWDLSIHDETGGRAPVDLGGVPCVVARADHPRRGYDVEVVGAALLAAADGAGHRRVAARVEVPAGTVRGWLRAVRAGAPALTARAVGVAAAAGASVFPARAPARWAGRALPEAVAALGAAPRAFALSLATPRPPQGPGGHLSGVDYLAVIAERHRRHLHRRLRLVDPGGALAALRGWPLINLLTGGRLLACGPAD